MDRQRLTRGDQLILLSGIVLFVVSFFSWLGARITRIRVGGATRSLTDGPYSFTHNAWGYTVTLIAVLFGIAMLITPILRLLGLEAPRRFGPLSAGQLMLSLGTLSLVLVLTKVVAGAHADLTSFGLPSLPPGLGSTLQLSIEKTRSLASFVGIGAAAGLFLGGLLKFTEENDALPA